MSSSPITQPPVAPGVPPTRRSDNESDAAVESSHEEQLSGNVDESGGSQDQADPADSDDADYIYHPGQDYADEDDDHDEEDEDEDEDYDEEDEHDDEDDEDDHDYFDGSGGLEFELVIDELGSGVHDDIDVDEDDDEPEAAFRRRLFQILRRKPIAHFDLLSSDISSWKKSRGVC